MTQCWKLDENNNIVNLYQYSGNSYNNQQIPEIGAVGAYIPSETKLPKTTEPLWIAADVKIGKDVRFGADVFISSDCVIGPDVQIGCDVVIYSNCSIGANTIIGNRVTIYSDCSIYQYCNIGNCIKIKYNTCINMCTSIDDFSTIGRNVKIHSNCSIGKRCDIGDGALIDVYNRISSCATIGQDVKIGGHCFIGNTSILDRCIIEDSVTISDGITLMYDTKIVKGEYIEFVGCGNRNRTLLMYKTDEGVFISVGCQYKITLKELKDRVKHGHGTSRSSADKYNAMMPVFDAAHKVLSGSVINNFKTNIIKWFKK